jgi:hypothetical protein
MTTQRKSLFHRPFGTPETPKASGTEPVESRGSQDPAEEGQDFRSAMSGFRQRLMYAFPHIHNLDGEQIAVALGWITEMEALGLEARYRAQRAGEPVAEIDASRKELAQLREAYELQKRRGERERRARIAEIHRQAEADTRRQMVERRRLEKETQDYIDGLRRETAQRQREASNRRHEEFLRYIRGEEVIGRIEIVEK